ncbi:MAG: nucleotidyltransferase domain-containing protein [Candidatus Nanoarchaeia archaeon]|nr:nucleotidyltransferase domain-containing protein [Candidatus Nanoarchaeia archaeon]MDD5741281.1 nucleotidyltransferase domain-containing protein [Candidatus Nanoarchaeia archaeon]
MKNINQILKQQIEQIKPDRNTLSEIKATTNDFIKNLEKKLKSKNFRAEVFVGGSLSKGTLIKKNKYDVDVFVRFDKKYEDNEISNMLGKALNGKAKRIHGSRDYYKIIVRGIILEVIPVLKIKRINEARNITDLSYFHVNYIKKKLKNNKLAEDILLAKTFCHAQNCYGAESYIHGFSGYSLELLICHYGSFLNFLKQVAINSKGKIVIDDKKFYKNKNEVLRELNESKTQSPIILIDPTFKERNALAGLSNETFGKFKEICTKFLKNPNEKFFIQKNTKEELSNKYGKGLKIVEVRTDKQPGDIAGSKSKKFFEFFVSKLEREFMVKLKEFEYDDNKNTAYFYFVSDKKKDEIIKGPPVTNTNNLTRFKKVHKNAFIKNHIAYAKIKHDLSFKEFIKMFKTKEKSIIKEMSVKKIESHK